MVNVEQDNEGYLTHPDDWSREVARLLAAADHIILTEAHWEVIDLLREFYQAYEHAPSQRPLVNYVARRLGPTKGNSIQLMTLFGGSPAKVAARIAGLPRPTHCF
jgi:tRNA 2-thiouridine synthesizing protein E